MAKAKKGTPLGFKDSSGKGVVAGDFLRLEKHTVVQIYGKSVKVNGKKVKVSDLINLYPDFKVVSKIEDPGVVENPEWEVGDVITNGVCIGYFVSLTESKTAINLSCAWIRKTGTISTSWVISTKGVRIADPKELVSFVTELKKKGIFFDISTKQALTSTPCFAPGEFIRNDNLVGVVASSDESVVRFLWALSGTQTQTRGMLSNKDFHRCTVDEVVVCIGRLNKLGYSLNKDNDLVPFVDNLFADVRSTIIESLKNDSVKNVIDAYRDQNLHGKLTIQLDI